MHSDGGPTGAGRAGHEQAASASDRASGTSAYTEPANAASLPNPSGPMPR